MSIARTVCAALVCCAALPAHSQSLTRHAFPDGSGSVGLPAGWKVLSAGNGTVNAEGPAGQGVLLGMPLPVVSRNVAVKFPDIPSAALFPGSIRVDFGDPVRAMLDVVAASSQKAGGGLKVTKIKAVEPAATPNGRGAFVRFAASVGGKTVEVFGYYAILPIDDVQALFYCSAVQAPSARYAKDLPELMAIWRSWSLSDATAKARLDGAQKALAEVDVRGTVDAVLARRRQAAEEAARAWGDYLRR